MLRAVCGTRVRLCVLQLDAILPNAVLKQNKPANPKTKNQKGFKRMLIMEYRCPALGLVRLTVGQKSCDDMKIQKQTKQPQ